MSDQPATDPPADPPPVVEPASSADGPPAADPTADPTAEPATLARAAEGEPDPVQPPRWHGSAPVPPPAPRRRRWLDTAIDEAPPPPPPDPTRELPPNGRNPEEPPTPVDPWAGADLWGPHAPPYAPAEPFPPTRPYPVDPPESPPASPPPHPPAVRPPPAEPARRAKRRRRDKPPYDRPQAPPRDWRPPAGYVPVAVRRRRKWPWVLLLTLVACCGCPAYFGGPMLQQYPASAALPEQVADLRLRDDAASEGMSRRLEREMQVAYWPEDTFAGVYSAANGKRVVIFGATGFRLTPDEDVDAEIGRLRDHYELHAVRPIDTGTRGEHQRCGTGRAGGDSVVVCTWADHGSIASGVFDHLSVDDSARLLDEMRASIIRRGRP